MIGLFFSSIIIVEGNRLKNLCCRRIMELKQYPLVAKLVPRLFSILTNLQNIIWIITYTVSLHQKHDCILNLSLEKNVKS